MMCWSHRDKLAEKSSLEPEVSICKWLAFDWMMIHNLYIGNDCLTKHPLKMGVLGSMYGIFTYIDLGKFLYCNSYTWIKLVVWAVPKRSPTNTFLLKDFRVCPFFLEIWAKKRVLMVFFGVSSFFPQGFQVQISTWKTIFGRFLLGVNSLACRSKVWPARFLMRNFQFSEVAPPFHLGDASATGGFFQLSKC